MGQIVCTDKGILAVEQNKVLIPPTWNKTFAWGYADLSCRLGTYESDKVCHLKLVLALKAINYSIVKEIQEWKLSLHVNEIIFACTVYVLLPPSGYLHENMSRMT